MHSMYHLSAVLSSVIQNMEDGQHLCEALIPDQALLPPGRSRMVAWSELSKAISTESMLSTIAINKKLEWACIGQMTLTCSHASCAVS